jgi:RNA polymerase sigma-70 factor (ECF subfamily)
MTVEHNKDMKRLYHFIDELPAEYRCTITLIDLFELDYKEASQILKVPIGTIKSRLARARFQIKIRLLED